MLKLTNITKDYPAGDGIVEALRGIDLSFRENEFVSILGPSGSGKTTLLNIIGGLDQYTEGDLVINGVSTKHYKDKDWDAYRNYSIGFVFQTYNLIPHQTVLQNVELALTVSGVSKQERRKKAAKALESVGLADQLKKRPNQLSGGQMQRVAIARALVNDPDIILADEPTGALDTETSRQVLDILKEIAKDRLIIMVTHNPDLANRYSSRIIQMLDGKVTSDSKPVHEDEASELVRQQTNHQKSTPSMSFATSFMLSLKNLFTKKGRTILTAFAGSIGIMGIALVIAISQGMTTYVNDVQEDALSSYPLTIEKTNIDLGTLIETFMNVGQSDADHEKDAVYKKALVYDMVGAINNIEVSNNDLKSFKTYLEKEYNSQKEENKLHDAVTGIQYSYDLGLNVYTKTNDGTIIESNTQKLLRELMTEHMGIDFIGQMQNQQETSSSDSFSGLSSNFNVGMGSRSVWHEMLSDDDSPINEVLKKQYDVVYGRWPETYNEIILVLDKNNELSDLTLYALGLESKESMDAIMKAAINGTELEHDDKSWNYSEILENEYRVILNSNNFSFDEKSGKYIDLRETEAGLKYLFEDALVLKVVGIIRPNETAESAMISGSIAYTKDLSEYIINQSQDTEIVNYQKANEKIDVFSGLPFRTNTQNLTAKEKEIELKNYLDQLTTSNKAATYVKMKGIPSNEEVAEIVQESMETYDREVVEAMMLENMAISMNVGQETIENYISSMSDEDMKELYEISITASYKEQYKQQVEAQLADLNEDQLIDLLEQELQEYTLEQYEVYYDEVVVFSDNTLESNYVEMGNIDLDSPTAINLYASSFNNKEIIENSIAQYNEGVEELSQIKYTDYLGIIMSSVTTIINAITYVLLAFVAISLIVSSIMIGVITLISVQERTKEIGILRAIGASKSNVSSLFNAETMIIGFASGAIGVIVTYLLTFPINSLILRLTGIQNLKAYLPLNVSIILVLISILLSLFAGIIPSRSAAKKDPVVALRTE